MKKKADKAAYVKPILNHDGSIPSLNILRVNHNTVNDIQTSLTLDNNVLQAMERVVEKGNKPTLLKEYGLYNLVKLLNDPRLIRRRADTKDEGGIALSPGFAFNEMPPKLAELSKEKYEKFVARHLPSYTDTPNSLHTTYSGKSYDYGYEDLSYGAKAALAPSFSSLLYLLKIFYSTEGSPEEKFKYYIDHLINDVGILHGKAIEIARYCLSPEGSSDNDHDKIKRKMKANFTKVKGKTPEKMIKVAFNGASDLILIDACAVNDRQGLPSSHPDKDKIKQDSWIVTFDKKLTEFCRIFKYFDCDGTVDSRYQIEQLPEHEHDTYWQNTCDYHDKLVEDRNKSGNNPEDKLTADDLIRSAEKAMRHIKKMNFS